MSVEAQTQRFSYVGDGVTTVFPFPARYLSVSDIVVGLDLAFVTSGFTVSPPTDSGGNVTFSAAPANGVIVTLIRKPPISQLVDFINGQTVLEGTLDDVLDKLTMVCQYLSFVLGRALRLSDLDQDVTANFILPAKALRANKLLGFDANGDPVPSITSLTQPQIDAILQAAVDAAASAAAAAASAALIGSAILYTAQSLTGPQQAQAQANIGLNSVSRSILLSHLNGAKALGSRQPIIDGIAEGFGGSDGINAGASSNYVLDPGNRRVINGSTPGTNLVPTMTGTTTSGVTMTSSTSLGAGFEPWRAGDKSDANWFSTTTAAPQWLMIDFGVGVTQTAVQYAIKARVGASGGQTAPAAWELRGSNDNFSTFTTLDTRSSQTFADGETKTYSVTTPGAYRYYRLHVTTYGPSGNLQVNEIQLTTAATIANMTVAETGYDSLDYVPATLRVMAIVEAVDAAVLNTDATFEVSRDNGTTWSAAAVTAIQTLGTKTLVESALISVTGQPSGSKPAFRYKTLNSKRVYLHGATLQGAA